MPGWTWPKVVDLVKHLWLPVLVLGFGSAAGMIRVMRANLLDELQKPYVTTARLIIVGFAVVFAFLIRIAWKRNNYDDRAGFVEVDQSGRTAV